MYEFQVGGKGPKDSKAKRYVLPTKFNNAFEKQPVEGNPKDTTVGSVRLSIDDAFGYWFDFGDDWWHQINVVSIGEATPDEFYPKLINRTGESPPQYSDFEEGASTSFRKHLLGLSAQLSDALRRREAASH